MTEIDNTSGRRVARFTLIATLVISVIANVAHAVLAASEISLWLRVPAASIWPVLSFLAIEVIVKIVWRSTFAHYLARVFVLGPAIPAIIVSYEHQSRLLILMGDEGIVSTIGPVAIDGLMIGCTLALLFTRSLPAPQSPVELPGEVADEPTIEIVDEPAQPAVAELPAPRRTSSPNAAGIAAVALQDGASTAEAATLAGMSVQATRRYAALVRDLKANPHLPIDARKRSVRPDVVDSVRAWARIESTR